jgi:hypothetical protein
MWGRLLICEECSGDWISSLPDWEAVYSDSVALGVPCKVTLPFIGTGINDMEGYLGKPITNG